MMTFGDRLRAARDYHCLTLAEVAGMIGVTESTVQKYECGKLCNPKYEMIVAVSRGLHIPLLDLMGWDEENPDLDIAMLRRNMQISQQKPSAREVKLFQSMLGDYDDDE